MQVGHGMANNLYGYATCMAVQVHFEWRSVLPFRLQAKGSRAMYVCKESAAKCAAAAAAAATVVPAPAPAVVSHEGASAGRSE
jgi:hypothetical protein